MYISNRNNDLRISLTRLRVGNYGLIRSVAIQFENVSISRITESNMLTGSNQLAIALHRGCVVPIKIREHAAERISFSSSFVSTTMSTELHNETFVLDHKLTPEETACLDKTYKYPYYPSVYPPKGSEHVVIAHYAAVDKQEPEGAFINAHIHAIMELRCPHEPAHATTCMYLIIY